MRPYRVDRAILLLKMAAPTRCLQQKGNSICKVRPRLIFSQADWTATYLMPSKMKSLNSGLQPTLLKALSPWPFTDRVVRMAYGVNLSSQKRVVKGQTCNSQFRQVDDTLSCCGLCQSRLGLGRSRWFAMGVSRPNVVMLQYATGIVLMGLRLDLKAVKIVAAPEIHVH